LIPDFKAKITRMAPLPRIRRRRHIPIKLPRRTVKPIFPLLTFNTSLSNINHHNKANIILRSCHCVTALSMGTTTSMGATAAAQTPLQCHTTIRTASTSRARAPCMRQNRIKVITRTCLLNLALANRIPRWHNIRMDLWRIPTTCSMRIMAISPSFDLCVPYLALYCLLRPVYDSHIMILDICN